MKRFSELSRRVIGAAIDVHRQLGPGLLESVYQTCLQDELSCRAIAFGSEVPVPVRYRNRVLECGFRADLIVEAAIILELKSVERILPICKSQLLTYMRLTRLEVGMLINFNVPRLIDGIQTFHGLRWKSPAEPLTVD